MATLSRQLTTVEWHLAKAWLPLLLVPAGTVWLGSDWPGWALGWTSAGAIYLSLKWYTLECVPAAHSSPPTKRLHYLLLWPGMDAKAFFTESVRAKPTPWEWSCAVSKLLWGACLVLSTAPIAIRWHNFLAAWVGLVGIALVLLFGLSHLLSIVWRHLGVNALPIMNRPLAAKSLSDFWSNRWNLAFRDAARALVFQPLVSRLGVPKATLAVFAFSGIVHDLAMSLPVRAGIGMPTLYFLIQGLAVLLERSRVGVRLGLGRGTLGRTFAAAVVLGPLALLFHTPFLEGIILPTLQSFRSA
jgi:hypothetical protein